MQLFLMSADPREAARRLCDQHICSQARETMQILTTLLWHWGVTPAGPVDCGEHGARKVYAPAYRKHPCVLWAAACQAHAEWIYNHARELCSQYTTRSYNGKKHLCEYHLDHWAAHIKAHGYPAGMPESVTPDEWLATFDDETRAGLEWRVADANPPMGCKFGILALDMIGPRRGPYNDCLASYKEYYGHKEHYSFSKPMRYTTTMGQPVAKKRSRSEEELAVA